MKNKLNLRVLAIASVLAFSSLSSVAYAAGPQGPGAVTLTNSVGNTWTAAIGNTPALGAFTDVFTFTPAVNLGSVAWTTLINTSFNGMSNITFTGADLNGIALTAGAASPIPGMVYNYATLLPASPVVGTLTLTVHGINTTGGSYGGDLNVTMAPVPEPETYAMMLGGLGILAFLARGRKT
jgi:hypothetical protein